MSRRKQLFVVMTLRLDQQLSEDLENLSISLKTSRAAVIRRLLRLAVQDARTRRYEDEVSKEILK
jgi:metal-responsive CopG/Arc/MetJ family transcriptional regulator